MQLEALEARRLPRRADEPRSRCGSDAARDNGRKIVAYMGVGKAVTALPKLLPRNGKCPS